MATQFHRTYVNDRSFIRGAARLLVSPITQAMPAKISDVIALAASAAVSDVQTVTLSGPPTGGTFTLALDTVVSAGIAYNATNTAVQTALQAMSNIGAGNVAVAGAAGGPYTITFQGAMANMSVHTLVANSAALVGGAASVVHTTPGSPALALYDSQPGWTDMGATKNGITIAINNAEETFDIDQQLGIIGSQPTSWSCTVGTSLAESTPERMQIAWQGSDITLDSTPASGPEQEFGVGSPYFYTQRRLAVLYQRPSSLIRAYLFRIAQRAPAESTLVHNKTGEQQAIPVSFTILPDTTVSDVLKQFFIIRDQAVS